MKEEFNALVQNNSWRLVPYHDYMNWLTCKWIYGIKYNYDGSIGIRKYIWRLRVLISFLGWIIMRHLVLFMKPTTIRIVLILVVTYG